MNKKPCKKIVIIFDPLKKLLLDFVISGIKALIISSLMAAVWTLLRVRIDGNARMYTADFVLFFGFVTCCCFMLFYKRIADGAANGKGTVCDSCIYKNAVNNAVTMKINMCGKPENIKTNIESLPSGVTVENETVKNGVKSVWLKMRVLNNTAYVPEMRNDKKNAD